ncbi:MotE family protein [Melioribacter sp. OK-6-Me]|uniref:MotE family protein n=1 Tax=unclassified Melioribacter TaxID=2627329 RepID=UPI003EDA5823
MNGKVIISFILAFIVVTVLMIYGATNYRNIFAFDFTPVSELKAAQAKAAKNTATEKKEKFNPMNNKEEKKSYDFSDNGAYDTMTVSLENSSSLIDSINVLLAEIRKLKTEKEKLLENQKTIKDEKNFEVPKDQQKYKEWIKNTVKLYEAMDTKKAAKIIENYSDNIARDIIFSMKKKKAAEIIAELKPEIANRIISLQ